jgi:hypothetical protein
MLLVADVSSGSPDRVGAIALSQISIAICDAPDYSNEPQVIPTLRLDFDSVIPFTCRIAFGSGARATPVPGSIQHDLVFNSQRTPTGYADFLANPSALRKRIQGVDTTRVG